MKQKIAFFDIDGTLTSEIDGSIPESTRTSIRQARENGHLMYINTGRCFQNVSRRFQEIGFDGYICGCGTNIYSGGDEILYHDISHEVTMTILKIARETNVDILFESKYFVSFDTTRPIQHPDAMRHYHRFKNVHKYDMPDNFDAPSYNCDKFVIWYQTEDQLERFRKVSDQWFTCIDRGGTFREFVPYGFSKASGIDVILAHHHLTLDDAYALGDSNNDLPMLTHVPHSIAMGNSLPQSLFDQVSYVTTNSSADGILNALKHYNFI